MAINALLSFFDKADGESIQKGKEKWIEIEGWNWEIEADTSWTKGGGASVGKPNPSHLTFEHYFDTSSTVVMGYICTGKAFPKAEIQMTEDHRVWHSRDLLHDVARRRLHHEGTQHRDSGRTDLLRGSTSSSRP